MLPPDRLHPRDAPHAFRVLPQERFDAAWDALLCELPNEQRMAIAPTSCAGTSRANINLIDAAPITQAELREPSCSSAISGNKRVYVRQLAYPGHASEPIATPQRSLPPDVVVEAWLYVVDLRGPRVLAEIRATPGLWGLRANPGPVPPADPTTGLREIEPGFIPFAADGNVDDYGFLLSPVRLREEGYEYLLRGQNARAATVRARWGSRDRGYVVLPDPFRWACDAHALHYEAALDAVTSHVSDPTRAATRFVARTLLAWADNGNHLGVANELADGGARARAVLARIQHEERHHRGFVEEAARYVHACVDQPDFRVVELSGMNEGGQGLSACYQVWAVVTHRLTESEHGNAHATALCVATTDGPERLPRRYLFSGAVPPGGASRERFYVAGACVALIAGNLTPAMAQVGRGELARVTHLYAQAELPQRELPLHEALGVPAAQVPLELRDIRLETTIPMLPPRQNLLSHNMPMKQQSSFLLLNGYFQLQQPDLDDAFLEAYVRAGRDFVMWNIQDQYVADKLPLVKMWVKLVNAYNACERLNAVRGGQGDALKAWLGVGQGVSGLAKAFMKIIFAAPSPTDVQTTTAALAAADVELARSRTALAEATRARAAADGLDRRAMTTDGLRAGAARELTEAQAALQRAEATRAQAVLHAATAEAAERGSVGEDLWFRDWRRARAEWHAAMADGMTRTESELAAGRTALEVRGPAPENALIERYIPAETRVEHRVQRASSRIADHLADRAGPRGDGGPTRSIGRLTLGARSPMTGTATRGGSIMLRYGSILGAVSSACEAITFARNMRSAWRDDDAGRAFGNLLGTVGAAGCSLIELLSCAAAWGFVDSTWLLILAEACWPAAVCGALLGLGYLVSAALESNMYEFFARWSQFGIHGLAGSEGPHATPWSGGIALPAPRRPREEMKALVTLLSQFRMQRVDGRLSGSGITELLLGASTDDTIVRITVSRFQGQTVPETTSRGRHVADNSDRRQLDQSIVIHGSDVMHDHAQIVRENGRITKIRIFDEHTLPADDHGGDPWQTMHLTVCARLSYGSGADAIAVPCDPGAWVVLTSLSDSPNTPRYREDLPRTAAGNVVLSHEGDRWVGADGGPRPFRVPAPPPAPAPSRPRQLPPRPGVT